MPRPRGDDGNALVEFTYLAVLLMVPLVYVLLYAFQVQKAAFAVTEAARQAGRAYAVSATDEQGRQRAAAATALALHDQGIDDAAPPLVECGECLLTPGSTVRVTVEHTVQLPVIALLLPDGRGGVHVSARHREQVDAFQDGAP